MTVPILTANNRCPHCNREAVALSLEDSANEETVYWCAAGHVVVNNRGELTRPKLVYNFNPEDL